MVKESGQLNGSELLQPLNFCKCFQYKLLVKSICQLIVSYVCVHPKQLYTWALPRHCGSMFGTKDVYNQAGVSFCLDLVTVKIGVT